MFFNRDYSFNNFIFSSSATVYGTPEIVPITEDTPIGGTTNPYGTTKLIIEGLLKGDGHCPCKIQKTEENLCPCDEFVNTGDCHCKLWIKEE